MNLVYTLTAYPPTIAGAQLLQHQTARVLSSRHRIQVVSHWDSNRSDWLLGTTLRAPPEPRDYQVDGIPVHRLGLGAGGRMRLLPATVLYYPAMRWALERITPWIDEQLTPFADRADLIHNVRIGREAISVASQRVARRKDIPFVFTPVHHPRWTGWRYRVYLELYRTADLLIALTHAEKRILAELGAREERIRVTGFGPILAPSAHPEAFTERHGIVGPSILFLGVHYPYKGYQQLVRAAPLVWDRFPEAVFLFIGRAVGLSDAVFRAHRDPRILRLGEVPLQDKTDALAACTLLCVPSSQESFGGVYTEAWTFGKPVIGCNIPAVSDVISHGVDGLLVRQEPTAIADAICELLRSPPLAQRMGEAGRQKVEARYTWEKLASLTEQAYLEVLGSRPGPHIVGGP